MRKPVLGSLRPGKTQAKLLRYDFWTTVLSNVYRIKQLLTFVSVNMKCYWIVNNSYWPPLRVSQYELNCSITLHEHLNKSQQFYSIENQKLLHSFMLQKKEKLWHLCTNFWINPHNGKLLSRLALAQYQNSLASQLLTNNCW